MKGSQGQSQPETSRPFNSQTDDAMIKDFVWDFSESLGFKVLRIQGATCVGGGHQALAHATAAGGEAAGSGGRGRGAPG